MRSCRRLRSLLPLNLLPARLCFFNSRSRRTSLTAATASASLQRPVTLSYPRSHAARYSSCLSAASDRSPSGSSCSSRSESSVRTRDTRTYLHGDGKPGVSSPQPRRFPSQPRSLPSRRSCPCYPHQHASVIQGGLCRLLILTISLASVRPSAKHGSAALVTGGQHGPSSMARVVSEQRTEFKVGESERVHICKAVDQHRLRHVVLRCNHTA